MSTTTRSRLFVFGSTLFIIFSIASSSSNHMRVSASSSSGSNNYNVYNYDKSPEFTPDGRVLQVEYASASPDHSTPMIAVKMSTSISNKDDDNSSMLILMAPRSKEATHDRFVLYEPPRNELSTKATSERSDPVVICRSGILSDSVALLQKVQESSLDNWRKFRSPSSLGVATIAEFLAEACHRHALGGGIRPYGATLWVCGIHSHTRELELVQTDPSGAILYHIMDDKTRSDEEPSFWILGGGSDQRRALEKNIGSLLKQQQRKSKGSGQQDSSVGSTLTKIANIMLETTSSNKRRRSDTSESSNKKDNTDGSSLEIVILSSKMGVQRLDHEQIEQLILRATKG